MIANLALSRCVADWKNWEMDLKYNDLIQMAKYACKTSQTLLYRYLQATLETNQNQTAGTLIIIIWRNNNIFKHHINPESLQKNQNEDRDKGFTK